MDAGSMGTTALSWPAQITMPPECCPRWRGISCMRSQISRYLAIRRCWMSKPAVRKAGVQGVRWSLPFPCAHQLCESSQRLRIETERLARLARGGPSSIGNDIGGHRRAQFAIALIHVLNGAFTAVSAGQIEIDIRPLATFGGEETLKEQLHAHRINRRDAERIAHHAIRRRSAALHENALAPAELHDVPNDQEITREFQLTDQRQFAASLLLGFLEEFRIALRQIPFAHAFFRRASPETLAWCRHRARDSWGSGIPDRSSV